MEDLIVFGVLTGMGLFFVCLFYFIEEGRLPLVTPKIRVSLSTDYNGAVSVAIRNGGKSSSYATFNPNADDFDALLREAIVEARVVASGMRDADRHARRRLPV